MLWPLPKDYLSCWPFVGRTYYFLCMFELDFSLPLFIHQPILTCFCFPGIFSKYEPLFMAFLIFHCYYHLSFLISFLCYITVGKENRCRHFIWNLVFSISFGIKIYLKEIFILKRKMGKWSRTLRWPEISFSWWLLSWYHSWQGRQGHLLGK